MKPSPESDEKLERLIHQTLRALPDHRAPRALETRVLRAIETRAALPWWKQSFLQWPVAARLGFLVLSAGLIKVAFLAIVWAMAGFDGAQFTHAFASQFEWLGRAGAIVRGIEDFCVLIFRSIPALWLYGALAAVASIYLALFSLGATAYRTLYASR